MDRAIEIAVTYETTQQRLKLMAGSSSTADTVDAIKKPKHHPNRCHSSDDHVGMISCRNCGGTHEKKNCPAFGKECLYCHKRNHWAKVCLMRKKDERPKPKTVHSVDGAEEEDEPSVYTDTITDGKDQPDTTYANMMTNTGDQIRFKLDTRS